MGSVIAVMGVVIPSVLISAEAAGIVPLFVALTVYLAVASHYILPFHHLNILVGQGEENEMYSQKEAIRLGLPLSAAVFSQAVLAALVEAAGRDLKRLQYPLDALFLINSLVVTSLLLNQPVNHSHAQQLHQHFVIG